ncbi:hypothetical protein F2P79_024415 [Pimephales promelas]|nr:hypothetical protein F2P79_024412 [Pimephales promelas]KAG1927226.1 hypothetical protein F2P79_024415 [Pimephales promelas]
MDVKCPWNVREAGRMPNEAPVLRNCFISAVKTNRRSPDNREEFCSEGDRGSLCCAFSRDSCFGRCWVVVGVVTPHHIYGNDPRRQVVWRPHSLSAFDQVKHSYYSE